MVDRYRNETLMNILIRKPLFNVERNFSCAQLIYFTVGKVKGFSAHNLAAMSTKTKHRTAPIHFNKFYSKQTGLIPN